LNGCKADQVCLTPEDTTGYNVSEQDLRHHNFSVRVACQPGYVGEAKAQVCDSHMRPYNLTGCLKAFTCAAPNAAGYEVTEEALESYNFDVSATCKRGYKGKAKVTVCKEGLPYTLSGCVEDKRECVPPALPLRKGYDFTESSLRIAIFDVKVTCADGYEGTAASAVCDKDLEPYTLSGCEKIPVCKTPDAANGYKLTETRIAIDGFQVTAKCDAGYHGAAVVTKCKADETPYSVAGCVQTNLCTPPENLKGYVVDEVSTETHRFAVTATCAVGFHGSAKVNACTEDRQAYTVTGCEPTITCLAPELPKGYEVTETSLNLHTFKVTAACGEGYIGSPKVTPCEENLKPYILSGCNHDRDTCTAPVDATGYVVTENSLKVSSFNVAVTCAKTHIGKAKAIPCSAHNEAYVLVGCKKRMACMADPKAEGYLVTETDTFVLPNQFDVTAQCKPGYLGKAQVVPCRDYGQAYELSGCVKDTTLCTQPNLEGYDVTETSLTWSIFNVGAKCKPGYAGAPLVTGCPKTGGPYVLKGCKRVPICVSPPDAHGYTLTEVNLERDKFEVTAKCALGYRGSPRATACAEHGAPYTLSGCIDIVTCSAPKDATGYVVTETNNHAYKFDVTAACASGYLGTATVIPCKKDLMPYKLKGCSKDLKVCVPPARAKGYKVKEKNLVQSTFDVSVTCKRGYKGKAKARPCTADQGPYVLSGCKRKRR